MATSNSGEPGSVHDEEAEAVLAACRVLVAVSAQSIAAVENSVDLTQFRLLVIVASQGPMSLRLLAEAARIHISKASRTCDRLVRMGLLNRTDNPADRRHLELTLTPQGRQLVRKVMRRRRRAIDPILARMSPRRRTQLVAVLRDFADASAELSYQDLWAMGWTT